MSVSRDVMNRSRVAHRSEEILEHVTDAYYAVESDWSIVYWNHAMELLSGVARDDACGVVLWDVLPDVDAEFDAAHRRAFDGEHPHSADPTYLFGQWVSPRLVPDGDCLGVFLHEVRDDQAALETTTRALTETEVALKRSQQQVNVLEGLLVNDVRNAMVEIRGTADLLVTELADETTRGDVETIVEWGDDVLALVDEVWPLLDVLTGVDDVEPHSVRLDDAVIDALTRTQAAFPETTITGIVPEDVTVVADDLLTDVVEALVTDAVAESYDPAPAVHVSVETDEQTATIVVDATHDSSVSPSSDDAERSPEAKSGSRLSQTSRPVENVAFGCLFAELAVDTYAGEMSVEHDARGRPQVVLTLPLAIDA